ncbi:MAG: hypothetical protein LBQ01_06780 [Prevotellaceae bacterium]|jgi:hypothetical protein|nr:hypothetical protein [Prevotellaceae bacterium]
MSKRKHKKDVFQSSMSLVFASPNLDFGLNGIFGDETDVITQIAKKMFPAKTQRLETLYFFVFPTVFYGENIPEYLEKMNKNISKQLLENVNINSYLKERINVHRQYVSEYSGMIMDYAGKKRITAFIDVA